MSIFKKAADYVKTGINQAISNGMDFSVQVVPLENKEGEFPSDQEVYQWAYDYVFHIMKYKPPNERALAGMKKAWVKKHGEDVPFVPKKQAAEILVILIAPSISCLHVFCSRPNSSPFDSGSHDMNPLDAESLTNRSVLYSKIEPMGEDSVFKLKDNIQQSFINDLKHQGICLEEEEEDDFVDYLNQA